MDVYDQSWISDTYPIPPDASPEEAQERRERAWKDWSYDKWRHGLEMWRNLAKEHGKPGKVR